MCFTSQKGIASLPTIMALTILILAISITVTGVSLTENLMSSGQKNSSQAFMYAEAGARDALMRVTKNKNYSCTSTNCYSLDLVSSGCSSLDGCALVAVSAGVGSAADPKIIISTGRVKNYSRKVQVSVVFDTSLNGEIASATWQEVTN